MKPTRIFLPAVVSLALFFPLESNGLANDDQLVYTEMLNNGWANWGYGSILNFANSAPVHSGSNSISATLPAFTKIWFVHDPVDTSLYTNFTFWVNGGPSGGQRLQVAASTNGVDGTWINIGPLATNSWQQITVSLAALGVANQTNLNYLWINNWSGTAQPVFYVDDVALTAAPAPATVHVGVNAARTVRIVDSRVFGINNVAWDGSEDSPGTIDQVTNMGIQALRWPGGSWGDGYHWTNEEWSYGATGARTWGSFTTNFIHTVTNAHAQVFIIANYGSSTPQEAAFGVAEMNITNHCNFKYWEIGNEVGGSWELDLNTNPPYQAHDPWTYAMRFAQYYAQMKAIDPTIKIGAVADTSEDGTANYTNHAAVNPVTGVTHYGWTPVMLYTMRTNNPNALPDFLIDHSYAPNDGDTYNLLWSSTHWQTDAGNLRMMLNDYLGYYLGTNVATNIELCVTEYGPGGDKQPVSLVGGLFDDDAIGAGLQTEFNAFLRWDLHNGQSDLAGSDNAVYGWRTDPNTGDYLTDGGVVNGDVVPPNPNCYPAYYCMKLLQYFARGGDTVVTVTNDYKLLGTYAVRRADGILTMLVVNKSSYATLNAAVNLAGYIPSTNAAVYSYGIPQDDAARTGVGSMDVVQTNFPAAGANFNYPFPPYSATVLSFTPTTPSLIVPAGTPSPGQFVFQLQGLPGVPYVVQTSPDLAAWTSVSTNWLAGNVLNLTNPIPAAPQQFWRAVWLP